MIPAAFPQKTLTLTPPADMTTEECGDLDVYRAPGEFTLSAWRPSWRERCSILWHGRVWVWVHAGGVTQPPISLKGERSPFPGGAK